MQIIPLLQCTNSTFTPVSKLGIYDFSSPRKRRLFPNPHNTQPHYHTRQFSSASAPTHPQLSSVRSFDHTGSYLCHFFLSRSQLSSVRHLHPLPQLSLLVFSFHSTYLFLRLRVLGRHQIGAHNLKDVFFYVLCDRYHSWSAQISCGRFNPW